MGKLRGEDRRTLESLFDRIEAIRELPATMHKIDELEDLAADAMAFGFPHLTASCRWEQFYGYHEMGASRLATESYVKLMQHVERYMPLISDNIVDASLREVFMAAEVMLDDPAMSLERINRVIDLVQGHVVARGLPLTNVYMARAQVAAELGDASATREWIDRTFAVGHEGWLPNDLGTLELEIPILAKVDLDLAVETLTSRLHTLGFDPRRVWPWQSDCLSVVVLLAFLLSKQGREREARAIINRLRLTFGAETLAFEALEPGTVIRLLEHRPKVALPIVDLALESSHFDGTRPVRLASVARQRMLADPNAEEGRLLQALCDESARLRDQRVGTDIHTRELREYWWAGIPDAPPPTAVRSPAWHDPEDRAALILDAGWFPRQGRVSMAHTPIALRDRFVALFQECSALLDLDSRAESLALAQHLHAKAMQLRSAPALYCIAITHGLHAGLGGDIDALVHDYERGQGELLAGDGELPDLFVRVADLVFLVTIRTALAAPSVSWKQIRRILDNEARLRRAGGRAMTPIALADAQIAHQRRDRRRFQAAVEHVRTALRAEAPIVEPHAMNLELVRLMAFTQPAEALALADSIADEAPALYARSAAAWAHWLRAREGDPDAPTALRDALAAQSGDLDAFHDVPAYVFLDGIARGEADVLPLVDAALESIEPVTADDLPTLASASRILMDRAPDDPRGPELKARAGAMARDLDARDRTSVATTWIREVWLPDASAD